MLFSSVAMTTEKIKSLEQVLELRRMLRDQGKRVVFTNGCFDILHVGHVRYLAQARQLGDALLVAVNSDRSIRELKGDARPIVPERERAEILSALSCVDYVLIFDDRTPLETIEAIVPDILVKGADWGLEHIVGREIVEKSGGVVMNLPLVGSASTTEIIERVLANFSR